MYILYLVRPCYPSKLYVFHHLLRPNDALLDLVPKNHRQCNPSKFLIDNLYATSAVLLTIHTVAV